jgi:hypothetical protein
MFHSMLVCAGPGAVFISFLFGLGAFLSFSALCLAAQLFAGARGRAGRR